MLLLSPLNQFLTDPKIDQSSPSVVEVVGSNFFVPVGGTTIINEG